MDAEIERLWELLTRPEGLDATEKGLRDAARHVVDDADALVDGLRQLRPRLPARDYHDVLYDVENAVTRQMWRDEEG